MKLKIKGKFQYNMDNLMRKCGYARINTREVSYARSLSGGGEYPRFHVYIYEKTDGLEVNLHIDQKKPSYSGQTAHSGDYDSDQVKQELIRISWALDKCRLV